MMRSWEVGGGETDGVTDAEGMYGFVGAVAFFGTISAAALLRDVSSEGTAFDTPSFCRLQAMILVLHVDQVVIVIE
jgi:hypothetical protein